MMPEQDKPGINQSANWLLVFLAVALVGYFSPWISRQPYSAALNWNAYDLYDAVMRLPEIESGAIAVNLQTLRAPLLGLAFLLVFHLAGSDFRTRFCGTLFGCVLALITLPPYPLILTAWHTPGWSVPFWWAVGTALFCLAGLWFLPRFYQYTPWLSLITFVFSALPAASTLNRLLPALSILHDAPVSRGWGFWMTELGMLAYTAGYWLLNVIFTKLDTVTEQEDNVPIDSVAAVREIKMRHEARLLAIPDVISVGIGAREGFPEPVIIVSVRHNFSATGSSTHTQIPQSLEGVAVCIEEINELDAQERG